MLSQPLLSQNKQKQQLLSNFSSRGDPASIPEQFRVKLLEMEGECRIDSIHYLRLNPPKAFFYGLLLTLSLVGLLLLKYYKKLRAFAFYDALDKQQISQATHILVGGGQAGEQISPITRLQSQDKAQLIFQFKKLRYELLADSWLPLGVKYWKEISTVRSQQFLQSGLTHAESSGRQVLFGRNEHKVQVPTYPEYLFDTMTQPLFLFQYFVSLIYALESFALLAFLMIFFGFVTTSVNYILLVRSYRKIKQTAEKLFPVQVLRQGTLTTLNNTDLVPGDLYLPSAEIPCDSILVRGEMFVDEVSLTGENVPIAKFSLLDQSKIQDKSHWLFQGAKLETMKEGTLALAVNVGYGSRRGRIIRKILTKVTKQPEFFLKLMYFQVEVMLVSLLLYLATLSQMNNFDIDNIMKVLRLCDFITFSFPAPYPIFFNLAYSFCLMRLGQNGVVGTQAEKTVEGARLKTICFDKTGTLTQNKMQVAKVYAIGGPHKIEEVTSQLPDHNRISELFACCNSVELINGEVKGDEIDLRLFDYVSARLKPSRSAQVVRQIEVAGETVEVLKINQYESQFQSMSVLIRDPRSGKHFVYVKGSPEMVHKYSTFKLDTFDHFLKHLSFSGFRTIGYGYKQILPQQLSHYLNASRQEFLQHTEILGLVTFINLLKPDAISTLHTLHNADIRTKIITGDNIFLGVQTAFSTGMIRSDQRVVVVEGSKYDPHTRTAELLELTKLENGEIKEERRVVDRFEYVNDGTAYAIDNDFIKANPQDFLADPVTVFARISPENKALIVRRHREREQASVSSRRGLSKLFGEGSFKVGMVGDGANDLIAIKEADLGIGISESDAIYSASFAVCDLQQIVTIILESKNAERQINEMAKYYGVTQFLSIVMTLILNQDCAFISSLEVIYKNFVNTLTITLLIGLCRPATRLTRFLPNSNFLDLENHLVFWGTLLISSAGMIISYAYYSNTDDFVPNNTHRYVRFEDGWFGEAKSSTAVFISANILFILLPLAIYQSAPFKLQMWTNKPLTILILLNLILIIVISLATSSLSALTIQEIGKREIVGIWGIILVTLLLCIAFNLAVQRLSFKKKYKKDMEAVLQDE